eukprot:scaffold3446_cov393-Prasinococcus_capsulatus_cf.AAC.2
MEYATMRSMLEPIHKWKPIIVASFFPRLIDATEGFVGAAQSFLDELDRAGYSILSPSDKVGRLLGPVSALQRLIAFVNPLSGQDKTYVSTLRIEREYFPQFVEELTGEGDAGVMRKGKTTLQSRVCIEISVGPSYRLWEQGKSPVQHHRLQAHDGEHVGASMDTYLRECILVER